MVAEYALIGDPVEHSSSDRYHNALLQKLGLRHQYSKHQVTLSNLSDFLSKHEQLKGLSVTMPLKEAIIDHLDVIDESVQAIGACNTLKIVDGKRYGFNTDAIGALTAIEKKIGSVKQKHVLMVGAGGAAKAIAWALTNQGGALTITNRTAQRAQAIAKPLGATCIDYAALKELNLSDFDLLIQATGLGMDTSESILPLDAIPNDLAVFEIISKPANDWAHQLKVRGNVVIEGIDMWVYQAIAQYQIWFDDHIDAPKASEYLFKLVRDS